MYDSGFPYGAPDFNDQEFLEFSDSPASGVLTAGERYRISTDADCMIGFGEVHDEGLTLLNGAFLGADQSMYVDIDDNTKFIHAVSHITTTSGIVTANRLKG